MPRSTFTGARAAGVGGAFSTTSTPSIADPADTVTFVGHGLPNADEGGMQPRALNYDGATFTFATSDDDPIDVWGFGVGVESANTMLVRNLAETWGREYTVTGSSTALSASLGETIYLQSTGLNGITKTAFRMWQFNINDVDQFTMHPDKLGETTVSPTVVSRKEGEVVFPFAASPTLNWNSLTKDQLVVTLTANIDFSANTITWVDDGWYTFRIVQDGTGGWTVTWPTIDGQTPIVDVTADAETVVLLFWDGATLHSTVTE